MAWEMSSSDPTESKIYNYYPSNPIGQQYQVAVPEYFTWMTGSIWNRNGVAIKFINDTENPMVMSSISIKTCACDSGGDPYYAFGGWASACVGYGADYICYVRVSNDGEKSYQESEKYTNDIPTIDGSNMNYQGGPGAGTAIFGNPPYTGYKALQLREYTINNCPEIQPGGIAYVHLDVTNFKGNYEEATIRFILNPLEMDVYFEPDVDPYIWVYESDHKWHLRQPFYVTSGGKWTSVEKL